MGRRVIEVPKIKFQFEDDLPHCIYKLTSSWLTELDELEAGGDKKLADFLRVKVLELEQLNNRTGKPNIHFKYGKSSWYEIKYIDK